MREYRENPDRPIIHDMGFPSSKKGLPGFVPRTAGNTDYYGVENPWELDHPKEREERATPCQDDNQ